MDRKEIFKVGAKGILKLAGGIIILGVSSAIGVYLGEKGKKKTKDGISSVEQTKNAYGNYIKEKKRSESFSLYEENLYEDIGDKERKTLYEDVK